MDVHTIVLATSVQDAVKKYIRNNPHFKDEVQSGKVGGCLKVNYDNGTEELISTTPLLVNLGILTKEQAIHYLSGNYTNITKDKLAELLDEDIQKCKWILEP